MKTILTALGLLLLWWLFTGAISPSYLVEGTRNHLQLDLGSKENYVMIVHSVRYIYSGIWLVLCLFLAVRIGQFLLQKYRKVHTA